MADYILESIKCITISEEEVLKRIRLVNKELLQKYKDQNRSCIATAGHYGNWEMCGLGASLMSPVQLIGVYKPLMNLDIENYMSKVRQKWGLKLVPMKQVVSAFEDNIRQMNAVYILVGDQSPSDPNKAYWTNFLNQDTAYHFGIEKYAHQYNLPVIFCKVIPEKRGYYCIELVELIDDPKKYKDTEITEICKNFLQDIIIENPVPWLWSHRRWKHQKPA